MERKIGGKVGKGCQGTYIKDTWTKPKGGVRLRVGGRNGWGWGIVGGKMETTVPEQQFKKRVKKIITIAIHRRGGQKDMDRDLAVI